MPALVQITGPYGQFNFIGGPYRQKVENTYGVKLAPEVAGYADYELPVQDFGTWSQGTFEDGLVHIIEVAASGKIPYVGCMMGQGRTGTVIAGLYRVLGDGREDPVDWTRENYNGHAVETEKQEALVRGFDVKGVRGTLVTENIIDLVRAPVHSSAPPIQDVPMPGAQNWFNAMNPVIWWGRFFGVQPSARREP